jgi:Septum formation
MARLGIRIAIVAVIAIGGFIFRDRIAGNAGDLRVGDCFDVTEQTTVEDVQHHPCNEAHTAEVVLVSQYAAPDGAAYPTDAQLLNYINSGCANSVAAYVGPGVNLDTLDWGMFYPGESDWSKGERKVTCYVALLSHGTLTKSLKAGAQ